MIGAYLGSERVVTAADGTVSRSSLESFADSGTGCHVVIPVGVEVATLADTLTRLQQTGLEVQFFHDAAALAAAALGLRGTSLFVELDEDVSAVARVVTTEGEVRRQTLLKRSRAGRRALRRVWTDLVAESMVLAHRFDPLHDRDSEVRLANMLWDVASRASVEGSVVVNLPSARGESPITLTRDQFAVRAAPIYRELSSMLHELRPAAARLDLLVMADDLRLPGFAELLAEFRGCCILALRPEDLALAASGQPARTNDVIDVLLLRGYPTGHALIEAQVVELPGGRSARARPTHLLWNSEVRPLAPSSTIEIGRTVTGSGVSLPDGLAGVSRWHCSLRMTSSVAELIDHSAHGTWLNDERVMGRAEVFAGDRIRIGDPGVELTLLAIGTADGAPAG